MTPLNELAAHGQSVWLDYLRRNMLTDGGLEKLIENDGVVGLTSNPTIFEKALAGNEYDDSLRRYAADQKLEPAVIFEKI
ncbi:MAG TPA: transaldolase family protein, partial [Alphaproteobacteria bacterium]|nr:transaldolase family protein [Alphaproteobacteria bacterium]